MHLTTIQRERLLNRDKPEFANVKRTNDYLVREALKDFLDLEDVNMILENLPKEQIEKVLTDEHIDGLLTLALKLYDFLGPGEGPYYEVPFELQSIKSLERGKKDVAKISGVDKKRASRLTVHLNRIGGKDRHGGEIGRRENYYKTYMNLESMANRGMKVPYKKKEGKKIDMLTILELDKEPQK
jgi:hypothetical protein